MLSSPNMFVEINYSNHNFIHITQQTKLHIVPVMLVVMSLLRRAVSSLLHSTCDTARTTFSCTKMPELDRVSWCKKWNLGLTAYNTVKWITHTIHIQLKQFCYTSTFPASSWQVFILAVHHGMKYVSWQNQLNNSVANHVTVSHGQLWLVSLLAANF